MKKQTLLPLTLLAGALALGYLPGIRSNVKEVKATGELETYIEMGPGAFNDYSEEKGSFAGPNDKFWGDEGYTFNALDTFFRGESAEGWTGTLRTRTWLQVTQFIYFQWGGANPTDNLMSLEFHYGEYTKTVYNETFSENPMMLDYFKIPDEEFVELDSVNGFEMYIVLNDNRTADYGFHNFGYLHVNQTEEQVSDAMRYYLNHIDLNDVREWKVNNNKTIYNYYSNSEKHLREVFLKTVENVDEDFESQSDFTKHWYLDVNYDNFQENNRFVDTALSNIAVRDTNAEDSSNMPFNNNGSYFAGWHNDLANKGYIANDNAVYRFVSRPFVLSGTGIVSVKMAGRSASLHVIDAETQSDLAWADLRTFNDQGEEYPQVLTGFNTVTMVRHYINLSEYLGKTIQLALADVFSDHWASSYFDDLVTYYEEYPSFTFDIVGQARSNPGDSTSNYYFDQYIASTHIDDDPNGLKYVLPAEEVETVDESPMYIAYSFLKNYYQTLRTPNNEFDVEKVNDDAKLMLVNEYKALDEATKKIVDESSDLTCASFSEGWYKSPLSTTSKVKTVMNDLVDQYTTYTISFDANGGTGTMADVEDAWKEYTLPACSFVAPANKEFDCWIVGEKEYQPAEKIDVTGDVTVKAKWKDIVFTVKFNANGGSGTMESEEVAKGSKFALPQCKFVAPEGKEFDCWIIKNVRYAEGDKIDVNSNLEVFANWKKIKPLVETYTVTLDPNGGVGVKVVIDDVSGDYELPECDFIAPEGKEFDCWSIDGESYQPGDFIEVTENLVIKASWKDLPPEPIIETKYTVSFNSNGGTGSMSSVEVDEGEQYTLPSCSFTAPEGKEFEGWLIGETKYQAGDKIVINSDTEVKASWKDSGSTPDTPVTPDDPVTPDTPSSSSSGGCGGNITMTSVILSASALALALLFIFRRKNEN